MSQFLSEYLSDESLQNYIARVYYNTETNTYMVRCLINGVEDINSARAFLTEQEADNFAENYALGLN